VTDLRIALPVVRLQVTVWNDESKGVTARLSEARRGLKEVKSLVEEGTQGSMDTTTYDVMGGLSSAFGSGAGI